MNEVIVREDWEARAEAWANLLKRAVLESAGQPLAHEKKPRRAARAPTLEQFWPRYVKEYCRANRNKPRTVERKEGDFQYHLLPHLGRKRLDEIRLADIQKLKGDLEDLNAHTVNNILSLLRTVLRFAAEVEVIPSVPVTFRQLKTVQAEISFYEPEVFEKLVGIARDLDPRAYLLVLLGGEAGLRRGEIAALEQEDIDFARNVILVRRSESKGALSTPKNGRSRRVEMTTRLAQALREHRHVQGPRVLWRDPAYRWDRPYADQGIWDRTLQSWMERVQQRAGVKVTGNIHILRHTFCTRLAMAGVPTRVIKEMAGHASITTTERYMHLAPGSTREAVRRLEALSAAEGPSPDYAV